ncbi:serine/threonine-protein kinase VRK3 isoform X1 [Amia ocellicauda]|uniref:serine/threonine-protein kinase VRK3 isoform X1 n=1 Tax=Amia ocellicauda TaxID=2972642 RepID=UPI003464A44E
MILHFCPQCGNKLQSGFKFCPSCGEKLPVQDPEQAAASAFPQVAVTDSPAPSSPVPVIHLSPLRRTRLAASKVKGEEVVVSARASPSLTASPKSPSAGQSSCVPLSPRKRLATPVVKHEEESSVGTSTSPKSPSAGKSKAKRARKACAIEPLQEGELLTDSGGKKWTLGKLLSQSDSELLYGVQQNSAGACSSAYKYVLKLASKDGRIFNELNFLQRAAKPALVDKWMKRSKMDFLGIPVCVGFGIHVDAYRFLVLPNMGRTLQSILAEGAAPLSEKAVLQISCRLLDVLEYIHENEYVHADIQADNVYLNPTHPNQVYLAGYHHAFRYCPATKHVEYREGSRTPHEGAVEFISLDSHKGAGPSRRSDLQALGYCMLSWHTGSLPWTQQADNPAKVMAEKERYKTDIKALLDQCFGRKKVPAAMQTYLCQVMALQYSEKPDYQGLRSGMTEALQRLGASLDQPVNVQM